MFLIYSLLLSMNCLTEFLFNKIMVTMEVLEQKYILYHGFTSILRILWIFYCAWINIPLPVFMIGLFILFAINIIPYFKRLLLLTNFTIVIYLIYIAFFMMVIGLYGIFHYDMTNIVRNGYLRVIIFNLTFIIFNVFCFLLLRYQPKILWKEDYDRLKVIIYTRFLFICCLYQFLDSMIISLYPTSRVNYVLLIVGDVLILILMFNFFNYNFVFEKQEIMKKQYEENEILIAQQHFEKEKLKRLSEYDSLTNAYNRREISSLMEDYLKAGHQLVCVFADLDGLKMINDKYGHTYGDIILKRFSEACTDALKEIGKLARIGGDEFLLLFIDQNKDDVERCIKNLQQLLQSEDDKENIYFSYGISYDEDSVENYIMLADQRMYENKNKKRSAVL